MVSDFGFDRYGLNTSILLTKRKDGISISSYDKYTGRPQQEDQVQFRAKIPTTSQLGIHNNNNIDM
jgi:hypothetical protein